MAQHEGVKYNDEGIPVLELPEAIPVRLPKYTYETYEREERPHKEKWDAEFAIAEQHRVRTLEIKLEITSIKRDIATVKRNTNLTSSEKKQKIEVLLEEIETLTQEFETCEELRKVHYKKGLEIRTPWRREQRRRWEHGWAGLFGIHYFYLTQVKIKDAEGFPIRPVWRNVDELIFAEFLDCLKNQKDLYIFKRREIGLSSVFGGVIPLWISIMFPGSRSLMTSADLRRAEDLLAEKLIFQHAELEDWARSDRKTYDKKKGAILAELNEDGNETGLFADITCRQTSQDVKDTTNLEGARAKYAFLDELFLHPFPQEVRRSVESCLLKGMKRVGIMVAGGSAGSVSRLGMKEAKSIWEASEKGGRLRCMLLKGSLGIADATIWDEEGNVIGEENFCVNGWDDEARAEAYIRWQRAILDLKSDKGDLLSFTKRYPLVIEEVFTSDEVGVIPEDVADKIPAQELDLKNHPRNIRRIKITEGDNEEASFVNDPNGAWMIIEEPVKGAIYEMGTDTAPSMMTKEETTMDPHSTDRSMNACVIKRVDTETYVAIYLKRTSDEKVVYKDISSAQKLYNDCKNMIERNRAEMLYVQYKWADNLNALAFQPKWIGSKGWKPKTIRGVFKASNEEKILTCMFGYFRTHMDNVGFPIILEQLRVFGLENADLIDAIAMCEVISKGREVSDGAKAKVAMAMKYKMIPFTVVRGGRSVVEYRKVPTAESQKMLQAAGMGMNWEPMSR